MIVRITINIVQETPWIVHPKGKTYLGTYLGIALCNAVVLMAVIALSMVTPDVLDLASDTRSG